MPSRFWTEEKKELVRKNIHLSDEALGELTGSTKYGVNQARLRFRILRPKRKPKKEKVCPICKKKKSVKQFDKYFSKPRNKYRPQNYCKTCQKKEKCRRSAEYYKKNTVKRKEYAKGYRANPDNKQKRIKLEKKFRKQYREELKDCYVASALAIKSGLQSQDIRKVPGLIEAERNRLKLVRTIRKIKHEKQIT